MGTDLQPIPPTIEALAELVQTIGASTWPDVSIDRSRVVEGCGRWWSLGDRRNGPSFDPGELFIAIACTGDSRGAIAAFERRYLSGAWPAVQRHGLTADERDELLQRVRERLFVKQREDVTVLLHCAGQGRIGGLVRVILVREAVRLRGATKMTPLALEHFEPDTGDGDALDRAQRQALLKHAFEKAVPGLDARSRCVLRLHYVRGISAPQIAAMYGVHRATASRWLTQGRTDLFQGVRAELFEAAPGLRRWATARLQSLVLSRLDLSLSRLFADE